MADDIHTSICDTGRRRFVEDLPEDCPLPGANEKPLKKVCRFYFFEDGDERNYQSHHALGKPFGNAGECRGKSISLQNEGAIQQIATAKRHSFFKKLPVALHDIPQGHGKALVGETGHIDFWPFMDFDFNSCKIDVFSTIQDLIEALNDEG